MAQVFLFSFFFPSLDSFSSSTFSKNVPIANIFYVKKNEPIGNGCNLKGNALQDGKGEKTE